jgi:hypothetical protein
MKIRSLKLNQNNNFFFNDLSVFSIFIFIKLIYWMSFGKIHIDLLFFQQTYSVKPYLEALNNHFLEYLFFFHTKPIGIVLYHKLSLLLVGNIYTGSFLFTSILNCFACLLMFKSLSEFKVNKFLGLLASINFSIATLAWEYWRSSSHFDHPNIFIFMFFCWGIIKFLDNQKFFNLVVLFMSSLLLGIFHSFGFILVPIFLILLIIFIKKNNKISLKNIIFLSFPVIIIALMCYKNYFNVGVFAPSTVGGQNTLQFASMWSSKHLDKLVKRSDLPYWWKWCYHKGAKVYPDIKVLGSLYGNCYENEDDKKNIKSILKQYGEIDLLNKIKQNDIKKVQKPWLFHGGIPESSSVLAVEYGKLSSKIWPDFLINDTKLFLTQWKSSIRIFLNGSRFFYNDAYEPQYMPRTDQVRYAGKILYFVSCISIIIFLISPIFMLYYFFIKTISSPKHLKIGFYALIFWSVGFLTTSFTCCENARMYVSVSTIPYLLGIVFINFVFLTIYKFTKKLIPTILIIGSKK